MTEQKSFDVSVYDFKSYVEIFVLFSFCFDKFSDDSYFKCNISLVFLTFFALI